MGLLKYSQTEKDGCSRGTFLGKPFSKKGSARGTGQRIYGVRTEIHSRKKPEITFWLSPREKGGGGKQFSIQKRKEGEILK